MFIFIKLLRLFSGSKYKIFIRKVSKLINLVYNITLTLINYIHKNLFKLINLRGLVLILLNVVVENSYRGLLLDESLVQVPPNVRQ